jgi:peptidoglycan/xylan/chitin deacetylase (PgdA/CDA1 family)
VPSVSDASMLKQAKLGVFRLAEAMGASRLISGSAWRRHRLLILCYHGVSKYDEHEWGGLYTSPETLRRRMEFVARARCNVLPLSEALQRLQSGTLPDRPVVITFDDGFHDFSSVAFPILESFGFPVTLYLTTYYVEFNRPVFDPMCSYLLWKGRYKQRLEWTGVFPAPFALDDAGRQRATATIKQFAVSRKLSGQEKDGLLAELAGRLDLDYEQFCQKRVMHLITPEEARELANRGVDLQYHTHRHRVYRSRERMFAELQDNRRRIASFTAREPRHFCYTGGFYLPEYPTYLKEYGMLSATTCEPGLCTPRTNPMLLPRLVDSAGLSDLEFRAWLDGTADLLPKRDTAMSEGQLLEEEELTKA